MNVPVFVGVNVSSEHLDAAFGPQGRVLGLGNASAGIGKPIERLRGLDVAVVLLEAAGGWERAPAEALAEESVPAAIANPRRVRDCARAMGVPAETDAVDAKAIAQLAAAGRYRLRTAPEPAVRELAEPAARRLQPVTQRTAELNRRRLVRSREVEADISRAAAGLGRRIERLDGKIAEPIAASPYLATRAEPIASVPGAGPQLAAAISACLPEPGRTGNKQVCASVGAAPPNRDGGKYVGRRFVWGGRARVRAAPYVAALSASQHDPAIGAFCDRPVKAGKPKKVALAAC